jgi:hypothetical protein
MITGKAMFGLDLSSSSSSCILACTTNPISQINADAVIDQSLLPGISRQLQLHMSEEDKNYTHLHIGSTPEGDFEIIFSEAGDLVESSEVAAPEAAMEAPAA